MRRPLCGAALIMLVFCLILPPSLWMHIDIPEGRAGFVGTVGRREEKNGMQVLYLKDTCISKTGWILVYLKESNRQYLIGNTLYVCGTLKEYEEAGNPGQFDSRMYYQTRKIYAFCYGDKAEVLDPKVDRLQETLCDVRTRLGRELETWMSPEDAAVMKAMLLGERQDMPENLRSLYKLSGLSHLLSISGLHISILGMGLYKGLRRLGIPLCLAGVPAACLMVGYGMMIGAGISTLRAITMFLLMVGADLLGRSYDVQTALAFSAIWMLLSQPLYARDSSFLLSFGAVLGLSEMNRITKEKGIGYLKKGLLASLGIQVVTLPILMKYFYEIPIYGPLLNLLVLPLAPAVLVSGISCAVVGCLCKWTLLPQGFHCILGLLCNGLGRLCQGLLGIIEWIAERSCGLPGNQWVTGAPAGWQIWGYYLCVGIVWLAARIHRRKSEENGNNKGIYGRRAAMLGMVYATGLLLLTIRLKPEFSMTMLDVGQGDSIYVETRGGSNLLVDGGSMDEKQAGTYILAPFLKYIGRNELDYVLVSHGDEDHISGIREIFTKDLIAVKCLVLPWSGKDDASCLELMELAKRRGCRVLWMKAGDRLEDQKLCISCISPENGRVYESENAGSLVLSLTYENLNILLTGDMEGSAESSILTGGLLEEAYDVLKVAHHGSSYSTGEKFLKQIKPRVSLISCGEDNSYGHPHPELLNRLEAAGCVIYSTPEDGAVTIASNGCLIRVYTRIRREASGIR